MSEQEPDLTADEAPPASVDPADSGSLKALDVDGVGAVAAGTVAWLVALLLCLALRGSLAEAGRGWWVWVCVSGAVLGLAGLWFVRRRRDAYAAASSGHR